MRLFFIITLLTFSGCGALLGHSGSQKLHGIEFVDEPLTQLGLKQNPNFEIDLSNISENPQIAKRNFLSFRAHEGIINALVATSDGKTVFTAGDDNRIAKTTLTFGEASVVANKDRGTKIWSKTIFKTSKPVSALSLSPNENLLAIAQNSLITIVDLDRSLILHRLTRIRGRITALAWDPRQESLAFGTVSGDAYLWALTGRKPAGEDTLLAVERYEAGRSPIIRLIFHQSGRAIFVAEQEGRVFLWRILRTEREIGLRDEFAIVDQEKTGRRVAALLALDTTLTDMAMSLEGEYIFVSADNGNVYTIKVRGAHLNSTLPVDSNSVFTVTNFELVMTPEKRVPLLAVATRGMQIKILCQEPKKYFKKVFDIRSLNVLGTSSNDEELPTLNDPQPIEANPNSEMQVSEDLNTPIPIPDPYFYGAIVAETPLFASPFNILRSGLYSPHLWGAEKNGSLVTFDLELLKNNPIWKARAIRCLDENR